MSIKKTKRNRKILEAAIFLVAISVAYLLITQFLLSTAIVKGNSMAPTLKNGERCLINKLVYRIRDPERGEIVCMNIPQTRGVSVKRVIGLPGERIRIKNGRIWINSRPLQEPYLPTGPNTHPRYLGLEEYEISANSYFVLGDNRAYSADSRNFGAIDESRIVGKMMTVLW